MKLESINSPERVALAREVEARRQHETLREIAESMGKSIGQIQALEFLAARLRWGAALLAENPTSFEGFTKAGFPNLGHEAIWILKRDHGIEGFADMAEGRWSAAELRRIPGVGPKGMERTKALMAKLGLTLRPDDEPGPERHVRQSAAIIARMELKHRPDPRGENIIPFPIGRIVRQQPDDQPPAA